MPSSAPWHRWVVIAAMTLLGVYGCDVPGGRGRGIQLRRMNPATLRGYWLYLPEHFRSNRRWPLVITLHGMKPFDNSTYQIHEWQPTADEYGLIVVAPDLNSPDLLAQFPLRDPNNVTLLRDELVILNILGEICTEVPIDPGHILLSCWSSGGFIAHYMMNRHPSLFAALAARESNFHPHLLAAERAAEYRRKPMLVFYGENDFPGVKKEAMQSAQWYREHGFEKLEERQIAGLGHQRRPGIAADFFARRAGLDSDALEILADPVIGTAPVSVKLRVRIPPKLGTPSKVEWFFGPDRRPMGDGMRIDKRLDEPGNYRVEAKVTIGPRKHTACLIVVARGPDHGRPVP